MFRYCVSILAVCICLGGVAAMTWAQPDPGNPPGVPQPESKDPQWIETFLPELLFRIRKEGESSEKDAFISGMFLNQEGLVLTVLTELRNDQIVEVVPELLLDKVNPPKITVLARDPQTGLTLLKTPFRTRRFFHLAQKKQIPEGAVLTPLLPLLPPHTENSFKMISETDPRSTTPETSAGRIWLRKEIQLAFLQSGLGPSTVIAEFSKSSEELKLLPTHPPGQPVPGSALAHDFEVVAVTLSEIPRNKRPEGSYYEAITAESVRPVIEQLLKQAELPALPAPAPLVPLNAADDSQEIPAEAVRLPIRYNNGEATVVYGILLDPEGTIVSPVESFVGAKKITSRWLNLDLDLEWLAEERFPRGLALLQLPSTSTAPHLEFELKTIGVEPNDRLYRLRPQSKGANPSQADIKPIVVVGVNQTVPMAAIPGAKRSGLWLINQRFPAGTPLFHETGAFIGMVVPDFTKEGSFVIAADQVWIAYGNHGDSRNPPDIESYRDTFKSGKQVVRTLRCSSFPFAKVIRTRMAELFPAYQFSVDPKSESLIFVPRPNAEFSDLHAIYTLARRMETRHAVESAERVAAMGTGSSPTSNYAPQSNQPVEAINSEPNGEPLASSTASGSARVPSKPIRRGMVVVTIPNSRFAEFRDLIKKGDRHETLELYGEDELSKSVVVTPAQAERVRSLTQSPNSPTETHKTPAQDLDRQVKVLVQKYQSAPPDKQPAIRTELEQLTVQQFDQRHQQRLEDLKTLEGRLEKLRISLSQREKLKDQIVQRRVDDILNIETPLKWEEDSASATPARPGTPGTDSSPPSSNRSPESQSAFDTRNPTKRPGSPQKAAQSSQSTSASPEGANGPSNRNDRLPTKRDDTAVRLTTGRILQVDFEGDAEISIGSGVGIKLGQFLDVHRQLPNTAPPVGYIDAASLPVLPPPSVFGFIGQLEVVAIQSDRSTCRAVPGTRRDFMRNNDEVTNDLSGSQKVDLLDEDLKTLQGSWVEEAPQSAIAKGSDASDAKDSPKPRQKLDQNKWTIDGQLLNIRHPNGNIQSRGVISLGRTKKTKFIEVRGLIQSSNPVPSPGPTSDSPKPNDPSRVDPTPSMTFSLLYRIQGDILEMHAVENYKSLANLPAEFSTATTPDGPPQGIRLRRVSDAVTDADVVPNAGNPPQSMR